LYRGDWPAKLWSAVPGSCDVDCVVHRLALLPPGEPDLRVGFISDVHLGPTTPSRLLDAAFGHLARARLDLLLLGGDYVYLDVTRAKARELAARVRAIPAARKVAVLGNHDLWSDHPLLEEELVRGGVVVLTNDSLALGAPHRGTRVVALDDPWTGHIDAPRAFEGARDADALLVLCHSPDGVPDAHEAVRRLPFAPPALFVCGHTHGGHIATPWGPVVVPGRVGKRLHSGLHDLGALTVFVSRGVGGIEVAARTYARPDVAVFELTARSPIARAPLPPSPS
jgi:predicted MPP superfamily phosphohydrolase